MKTKKLEAKVAKLERRLLECSSDMVEIVEREIRSHPPTNRRGPASGSARRPGRQNSLSKRLWLSCSSLPEVLLESEPKRLQARLASVLGWHRHQGDFERTRYASPLADGRRFSQSQARA